MVGERIRENGNGLVVLPTPARRPAGLSAGERARLVEAARAAADLITGKRAQIHQPGPRGEAIAETVDVVGWVGGVGFTPGLRPALGRAVGVALRLLGGQVTTPVVVMERSLEDTLSMMEFEMTGHATRARWYRPRPPALASIVVDPLNPDDTLVEVAVHELTHHQFPDHDEAAIAALTAQLLRRYQA